MTDSNSLPVIPERDPSSVPSFSCVVVLNTDAATGKLTGIVANLDGISATGTTERDVLMSVSRQFKSSVQQMHAQGTEVPWRDPEPFLSTADAIRYIPVHL